MKDLKIGAIATAIFITWLLNGCAHTPVPAAAEAGAQATIIAADDGVKNARSDQRFSISAQQAREVATVIRLIDAYNDGRLADVLALLAEDVNWSDCDYESGVPVEFYGKSGVAEWLRWRMADDDRLVVQRFENANPDGEHVIAIEYIRRQNGTLAQQGFPDGIEPALATKVIFTTNDNPHVRVFANGPVGGDPGPCSPGEAISAPATANE